MGKATVFVRNHRKRTYNGIRYMQIAEIQQESLDQYLVSGFLEFNPKTGKSLAPTVPETEEQEGADDEITIDTYTVKELKAYLDEHNISYEKKAKKSALFEKALANGLGLTSSEEVDETGLEILDEEDENIEDELEGLEDSL